MSSEPSSTELEQPRFELQECLGRGASGTVYRAYDSARETVVALKVLTQVDPASLFRFKVEFRALAGLAHPNLLSLYELVTRNDEWLLTMELVQGRDFLSYVRPVSSDASSLFSAASGSDEEFDEDTESLPEPTEQTIGSSAPAPAPPTPPTPPAPPAPESDGPLRSSLLIDASSESSARLSSEPKLPSPPVGELDLLRLRSCFEQLCEGLHALHQNDRLHRDLKPANVLVFDADGRLVICDFGLVVERTKPAAGDTGSSRARRREIAGTLAFMSPEQAAGDALSEASDWYSVGVMLYQALTNRLPIAPASSWAASVEAKRVTKPRHPCELNEAAPRYLAELALALLHPDPAERPGYAQIVMELAGRAATVSFSPKGLLLFGRNQQLAMLAAALAHARAGTPTVAFVHGRSGMGKSALVRHFLDSAEQRDDAIVLAGRCYEREELPYKAFDPLLDALSAHLLQLDGPQLDALLPDGTHALARLFPALRRVPGIAAFKRGGLEVLDPLEMRRRAFVAFREICRRLARQRPLILYIDDLQWGDLDSGPLFAELLHPPDAPWVFILCAYRSEDETRAPLIAALRRTHLPKAGIERPVEVEVAALRDVDTRAFAEAALAGHAGFEQAVDVIVREAGGSPFFVRELATCIRQNGAAAAAQLSLETLIEARLSSLPAESRDLLSVIAVAGRPERLGLVSAVAKLGARTAHALKVLDTQHLVLSTGPTRQDRIEAYHDRIRETAYRLLDEPTRVRLHRAFADVLEREAERDVEALLEHCRAAGDRARAGEYALQAGERAQAALAFGRAAERYREALELLALSRERAALLEQRLGHALALAGRGTESAAAFFRALDGAPPAVAMQLRGLATSQLLRAGRVAEALEQLKEAKAVIGVRAPTTVLRTLAMLLWSRLRIGLNFWRLRIKKASAAPELLQRLDMLWDISVALGYADFLRGGVYMARHVLLSLEAGEPHRLARSFSMEFVLSATANRNAGRTQRLIDRALEMAGISHEPYALAIVKGGAGTVRLLEGRWRESARLARECHELLRERVNATLAWEHTTMVFFELQAIANLGPVRQLIERVPEALRDAEARGDLYAATCFRTWRCSWAWLGLDQPGQAREQATLAEKQWIQKGYHLQHWYATQAFGDITLYDGQDIEAVWLRLEREWWPQALLRPIQHTRIEIRYTRARVALALAILRPGADWLRHARAEAKAMIAERMPWSLAYGRLIQVCAASIDRSCDVVPLWDQVEGQFDALDMSLHAAVARVRRGQALGAAQGEKLAAEGSAAIAQLGVTRPEAFVRMLAPALG